MFCVLPQRGFSASLAWVIKCVDCVHSPTGPAQTSGASVHELRIDAIVLPSLEAETTSSPALSDSSPVQRVSTTRDAGSSEAIAVPPFTVSVNRIFPEGSQRIQLGELLRSGVRL